jgi:hypothetical protein
MGPNDAPDTLDVDTGLRPPNQYKISKRFGPNTPVLLKLILTKK